MEKLILVVEDEQKIARFIRANLLASNYRVILAQDGEEALAMYEGNMADLVLLDIMLPKIDGFEVLKKIREFSHTPVIIVTAKGDATDAIKGLELGADDYIAKPFDINELLARIKAVLRRTKKETLNVKDAEIDIGDLSINFLKFCVKVNGEEIKLTPIEFKLLKEMVQHKGCVITHEGILSKVWGPEYRDETHYLRVTIARIRQKLGIPEGEPGYIQTVPTIGYKMLE